MQRYAIRMFADGWRQWAPAIGLVAVMATMIGLCVYQFAWTTTTEFRDAVAKTDVPLAEFQIISITIYTLVALVAWVALTVVGQASVHATRHTHALWLLLGASPRSVFGSTLYVLLLVSLCGAAAGAAIATVLSFWAIPAFNSAVSSEVVLPRFTLSPWAPAAIVAVSVVTMILGSILPARRASRIEPSVALRMPNQPGSNLKSTLVRVFTGVFFLAVAVVLVAVAKSDSELASTGPGPIFNAAVTAGGSALIAVYLLCPEIVGIVFRVLHRLFAASNLVVAALGTRAAAARAQLNTTTIAPLAVGLGGVGLLLCTVRSVGAFIEILEPGVPANLSDVLIIVAVVIVSMLATSAAVVALSSRGRGREIALLQVCGLREQQVLSLVAAESFAMALAASTTAIIPVVVGGLVCAFASAASPVGSAVVVWPAGIMILGFLGSWLLMFLILVLPTIRPLRDGPSAQLREQVN